MGKTTIFGILVALLILLGGLLYIAAQFILKKVQSFSTRFADRKKKLWIWRSFIIVFMIYSVFLLFANKDFFEAFFTGPLLVFFNILVVIYFVALVELVVIDLLLPDVVDMWKRIVIELVVFILLCVLTVVIFNISVIVMSGVI